MTEQKTTTTRKRTTRTKVQPVETIESTNNEEVIVEQPKVETPKKRELTDSTKVSVMNNTMGVYGYRNGNVVLNLSEYGDTGKLSFEEIQRMYSNATTKRHIQDAFIIVLDDDVVEELNLHNVYKNVLQPNGVNELFRNPDRLQEVLPKMPKIMQETVVIQARRRFKSEDQFDRLTDIRIAQVITNELGIDILE